MPTAVTLTVRNKQTQMALTTTEDTLTLTEGSENTSDRVVELVCDQAWGISDATGTYASKKPIPAGTPFRIAGYATTKIFYVHTATTSGTLSIWPL
ncbi:MAG: hypothetical protein H0U59_13605 [Gemmatimonadaceae bacterium]|nr:hypothetical protein [Gemmatimonadaceae bacterium]